MQVSKYISFNRCVPFRPTKVQMPTLALLVTTIIETKRITVLKVEINWKTMNVIFKNMESFFNQTTSIYFDIGSLLDNRYLNIQHFYFNISLKISNIVHKQCNMVIDISVNCWFFLFLRRRYCKDGDIPIPSLIISALPLSFAETRKLVCGFFFWGGGVFIVMNSHLDFTNKESRYPFILKVVGQQRISENILHISRFQFYKDVVEVFEKNPFQYLILGYAKELICSLRQNVFLLVQIILVLLHIHCKKSRRTFRCSFEEYLPDVEKIQRQCRIFLFIYLCVIFSTLLLN